MVKTASTTSCRREEKERPRVGMKMDQNNKTAALVSDYSQF